MNKQIIPQCRKLRVLQFSWIVLIFLFSVSVVFSQKHKETQLGGSYVNGAGEVVFSYTAVNPIVVNDNAPASPYPSTITAAGINPTSIVRISVTLNAFTHSVPDDVDILLESPSGQRSILMSDAGGSNGVSGINLVFSTSGSPIPDSTVLTSGTVSPANYMGNDGALDDFPSPGPGTLTNEPADLTVFNGTDPNGTWKLYVVDDKGADTGLIAAGWTLSIVVPLSPGIVSKTADTDDGTCDADCSLREAVTSGANQITFGPLFSAPQTITLSGSELNIPNSFILTGPGADLLTVSGNGLSRVMRFGINRINFVSGLTITGGVADSNGGGGIHNSGLLLLLNSEITGNSGPIGGGIRNLTGGFLSVTSSSVSGNSTNSNFGAGGIESSGLIAVTNSTISGNSSTNGIGSNAGGIKSRDGVITNTTISDNSAAGPNSAGGLYREAGTLTVRNTIIAGNLNNSATPDTFENGGTGMSSTGFNLVGNPGLVSAFNQTGDQTGNGAAPLDPGLLPLNNNSSSTRTHALQLNSPAIDAGDSSNSVIDQRLMTRPFDFPLVPNISDGADIGAFERQDTDATDATLFDYDGDSKTDVSIFRPGPGEWWYRRSSDGGNFAAQFGSGTDTIA
ncbi:MAG: CSLREA domain-containing protein, partial [Pyrinomonadaceae bacterium]|nr:CSLREA domain-containing protein [Pyrinomonadaceae bacterium]